MPSLQIDICIVYMSMENIYIFLHMTYKTMHICDIKIVSCIYYLVCFK